MVVIQRRRAASAPWPPAPRGQLSFARCVMLALLIHVLLVLVFGSAPGGNSPRGGGVQGPLSVRLAGLPAQRRTDPGDVPRARVDISGPPAPLPWGTAFLGEYRIHRCRLHAW